MRCPTHFIWKAYGKLLLNSASLMSLHSSPFSLYPNLHCCSSGHHTISHLEAITASQMICPIVLLHPIHPPHTALVTASRRQGKRSMLFFYLTLFESFLVPFVVQHPNSFLSSRILMCFPLDILISK